MENLYIIGNGFDLHNGFKTSYIDFRQFLKDNEMNDLLDKLEDYFDSDNLWSSFEETLGNLNIYKYMENNLTDINYVLDYSKSINTEFINMLHDYLYQWLWFVNSDIDKSKVSCLPINHNSFFISFNYTNTLEIIYNIKEEQIIYLHGKYKDNDHKVFYNRNIDINVNKQDILKKNNSDLILGHNNKKEYSFKKYYKKDGEIKTLYYDTESIIQFKKICKYTIRQLNKYHVKMNKNPIHQIELNKKIFENIDKYDRIIILGHSIGNVDFEYFKTIFNNIKYNTQIIISYYDAESLKKIKGQLRKLGLSKKIDFVKLNELQYYD